jgi:hypothetical protein
MEPCECHSSYDGHKIKMYKINKMGFKEVINIGDYNQKSMEKLGYKLLYTKR